MVAHDAEQAHSLARRALAPRRQRRERSRLQFLLKLPGTVAAVLDFGLGKFG